MGTNLSPEYIKEMEDHYGALYWTFLIDPERPDAFIPEDERKLAILLGKKPSQKLEKKPEQKLEKKPAQVTPVPSSQSKYTADEIYRKLFQSWLDTMKNPPTTIPQLVGRRDLSEDPRLFLNEQELGEYLDKIRELDYKDPVGGVTGPPPNAVYDLELKALNEWLENKKIEPPSVDHLPISQRPFYAPFFKSATTTEEYQPYLATGTPEAKTEGKAMPLAVREPPRLMWPAFYVNTEPRKSKATATPTAKSKAKGKIEARATPLGARDPPSVEAPLLLVSTEEKSVATATPTPNAVMERVVVPKEKKILYGPAWVKDRKLPTFAIEKDYTDRKEFDTTEMDPEIAAKINQAINIGKEAGSLVISQDKEIIASDKKAVRGGYTDEKEFDVGKMDPEFIAKMDQAANIGKGAGSLVISPNKTIIHARRNEECTSPICRLDRESLSIVLICLFILGAIIVVIALIFVMYYVPKGWRKLTKRVMRMRGGKVAAAAAQEQEFKEMVRESEDAVTRPKDVHMV